MPSSSRYPAFDEADELTSRRIFMPAPASPRRVAFYRDLLNAFGLDRAAWKLAFDHLVVGGNQSVLHVGCGDGLYTLEIKRRFPGLELEGIDAKEALLEKAGESASEAGLHVLFQKGYLQDLPDTAERHHLVLCVLYLHRVRGEERGEAFQEISRVLQPGGKALFVDFGKASGGINGWLTRSLARHLPGMRDHLQIGLEELVALGDFERVTTVGETSFGVQAVMATKSS